MTDLELLRHTVATLSYRAAKTMRDAPAEFADFKPGPSSKTPVQVVAHMGDLFDWAISMLAGDWKWHDSSPLPWQQECDRFFRTLKAFDDGLASGQPIKADPTKLFQGPIADALTHTGQLAALRRLADCPMKGESYARADIVIGRIGLGQTPADPRYEFDWNKVRLFTHFDVDASGAPLRQHFDLYQRGQISDNGTTLMRVPTGTYVAYAFQDIEPNSWWDPDVMQKYAGQGGPVRIELNRTQSLNLRLIPAR
jgi:hypothetical protein